MYKIWINFLEININKKKIFLQILHVFNDPFGEECKNLIEQYTTAKRPLPTPSVAITASTAFTQRTTIPSLNSYQDDSIQPEKPALPKPLRTDIQIMHREVNEPLPDIIPETAYNDSMDGFKRNDRHGRGEDGELWDDILTGADERDHRNHSRSPEWDRDRYHKDRYDERYYERKKHRKHRSRDRSRSRERRDSRRRGSNSRHRDSYHERERVHDKRQRYREMKEPETRHRSRHYKRDEEYGSGKESSSYSYPTYETEVSYSQAPQYRNYPAIPYPMYNAQGYQVDPNSWQPPPPSSVPPPPDEPAPKPPGLDDDDIWDEDNLDTAKSKPPPPPPPPPENEKPTSKVPGGEEEDESNVDLDTRIAMMFKGKSFGAAPPFLQFDSDSGEEGGKNAQQQDAKHQEGDDSNSQGK